MRERPDLFKAAAANEAAMLALWQAGESDPGRRNTSRMMEIGRGIIRYARAHDQKFPESIDLLFTTGFLEAPLEAKSLLTGKPYKYVAAGEKQPMKSNDAISFVVLYDDHAPEGWHECVTAAGMGTSIRLGELKEQLRKRGKPV